jgi:Holliday junction DNA helicase RuvA
MIERIKGYCVLKRPTGLVVDVNGVGYGVEVPLSYLCRVNADSQDLVELWIHTHVREDALKLYGFPTIAEREVFGILTSVSGIGPKLGMAILSTLDVISIRQAIANGMVEVFEAVPGIGRRMAEKILVELKSKLKRFAMMPNEPAGATAKSGMLSFAEQDFAKEFAVLEDVHSALENLGFRSGAIAPVLKKIVSETPLREFNEVLREALIRLGGGETREAIIRSEF